MVIEFVISQSYCVVSDEIHEVHDISALGNNPKAAALNIVTAGNHADVCIGFLQFIFHCGKLGISVYFAMHVIFIKNNNIFRILGCVCGDRQQADDQQYANDQCYDSVFHF